MNTARVRNGFKPVDFEKLKGLAYSKMMTPIRNSKNPKIQAALKGAQYWPAVSPDLMKDYSTPKLDLPEMGSYSGSSSYSASSGGDNSFSTSSRTQEMTQVDRDLGELEIEMDSINNKKGVSIFKVISRRYFRSAYPVFLKKENKVEISCHGRQEYNQG